MVGSISVRPQQVESLAASIRSNSQQIQQHLDDLDAQVKVLIDQWDGSAREAYYRAQSEWNSKIQEMNQILGQISQATSQIATDYVDSDNRAASFF